MTLSQIIKTISNKEWRLIIFLIVVVILITSLPLVYGWLVRPAGAIFSGIRLVMPNDWFVYYSHIEQVTQGHYLLYDLFTNQDQLPTINIFWLGVGLLAKFFNLSSVLVFNLVRVSLIPLLLVVSYFFIAYLLADIKQRLVAALLLAFGSGLGIFLVHHFIIYPTNTDPGFFSWPMDLWVPDFNAFLAMNSSPHFVASLTLILLIFFFTLLAVDNQKIFYSLVAGFCSLVLFAFHPFHILSIFSIIGIYFLFLMFKKRKWLWFLCWHYLILFILSLPPIYYYLYLLKVEPVISQKALQNVNLTTPLWVTFFSFGLLLFFAIVGLYFLCCNKKTTSQNLSDQLFFVVIWAIWQFLLLYWPLNYQRRFVSGLQFPLVILSTIGLFNLYYLIKAGGNKLSQYLLARRYLIGLILVVLLVSSNLFLVSADLFVYVDQRNLAYIGQQTSQALDWLKQTSDDSVVLNFPDRGSNIIPAFAGRRVYAGHNVETPFYSAKLTEVSWFFSHNHQTSVERNFLFKRGINYIFYGPQEKNFGSYDPAQKDYLKSVFANSQVQIYQVL